LFSATNAHALALAHAIEEADRLVDGRSYQSVLDLLGTLLEAAAAGNAEAGHVGLLGFWAACRHPQHGREMTVRLSDAIATDNKAHLTMHAGPVRGVAFALHRDRFVPLDQAARLARQAGLKGTAIIAAAPRRPRPGGRA
jgi:hypothetical protein